MQVTYDIQVNGTTTYLTCYIVEKKGIAEWNLFLIMRDKLPLWYLREWESVRVLAKYVDGVLVPDSYINCINIEELYKREGK